MRRANVHRPVIGACVTALMAVAYYQLGDSRAHDQFSAGLIALTFGFATLVVMHYTLDWLWRAVGVWVAIGGIALTYLLIWGGAGEYINFSQLVTRSILRASLDFGGVVTFLGLVKYVIERRRGQQVRLFGWLDAGGDE